nr:hypothetical protein [Halovivax sp. KZCA124]
MYIWFRYLGSRVCSSEFIAWGIVGLIFGPPAAIWPYKISRWEEIWDAIGRKPSGRVEPADWKVDLTRVMGVGFSLVGVSFLVFCVVL